MDIVMDQLVRYVRTSPPPPVYYDPVLYFSFSHFCLHCRNAQHHKQSSGVEQKFPRLPLVRRHTHSGQMNGLVTDIMTHLDFSYPP